MEAVSYLALTNWTWRCRAQKTPGLGISFVAPD